MWRSVRNDLPAGGGGGGGGGGGSIDTLVDDLTNHLCDTAFSCLIGDDDIIGAKLVWQTKARCTEATRAETEQQFVRIRAGVKSGASVYNAGALATCLGKLKSACIDDDDIDELCPGVFTGTIAVDGPCFHSVECAGGFCEPSADGCTGRCRAQRPTGAACRADAECDGTGLSGSPDCLFSRTSTAGTCVEIRIASSAAAQDATCGLSAPEANVRTFTPCQEGLWCSGRESGVCKQPIAVNSACRGNDDVCAGDAICTGRGDGGACTAVVLQTVAGATCSQTEGTYCSPLDNLRCSEGICVRVGDRTDGSECLTGDFAASCNPGLFCEGSIDRCRPLKANGAQCDSSRGCASLVCDSRARICVEPRSCPQF